ncbi:MAG: hypothetical protein ABI425_03850 [Patescibacteria group bacterium]
MISKELPTSNTAHNETVEGPLNERWTFLLAEVLNSIDSQEVLLQESTQKLFQLLRNFEQDFNQRGEKLKLIFLTRQGVLVYWLLHGIYDALRLKMPESEVLGIKAGNIDSETDYKAEDEIKLKEILGVGQDSTHMIFIDEMINRGKTMQACFNLVEQLGGNKENYSQVTLLDRGEIIAPWDLMHQNLNGYIRSANRYFSIHMYESPDFDGWKSLAEPARLNQDSNSQIAAYYVVSKLYRIGFESK